MNLETLLIAMSIPSGITGFCFWMLERQINKREEKDKEERIKRQLLQDERENAREKHMLYLVKSVSASIALSEATARAVQRIPDAHCNGDMSAALKYAADIKHEQKDFINEHVIKELF